MSRYKIASLIIVILSFITGLILYNTMPEFMASHWNYRGEVDGYMPRFWGLFLMPIISLICFILFIVLPRIDPLQSNINKFRKSYEVFIVAIIAFLYYIYLITIFWNLGYELKINTALVPAFSALFYLSGAMISKAKRNWFIGIKTPWTLSSDEVWEKTHKLGGRLFKISALIGLVGLFSVNYAFALTIFPIIASSVFLFFYSYLIYRQKPVR